MDRLEAQREKWQLLKERTLQYAVSTDRLQSIDSAGTTTNEMVDESVQTVEYISTHTATDPTPAPTPTTTTYDKGIQVETTELVTPIPHHKEIEPQNVDDIPIEEDSSTEKDLKSFVIRDTNTLINPTNKSFAAIWYAKGNNTTTIIANNNNYQDTTTPSKFTHLHSWKLPIDHSQIVTFDMDHNRQIVTIVASQLNDDEEERNFPVSFVFVLDLARNDNIIDQLELVGHNITRVNILRKFEKHNIISILLITKMGETILYELSENHDNKHNWQRNLISRKHFMGGQQINVMNENKFRIILGDESGTINLLNSLDLSDYRDVTTIANSSYTLIPINRTTLLNIDTDTTDNIISKFVPYLNKLLFYDQIHITGMVNSPFNEDCLFIGDIQGAIYKIYLNDDATDGKLQLDLNNNNFLPQLPGGNVETTDDDIQYLLDRNLFHSQMITTMSINHNGLLLTGSLDWTIILWDTRDNLKLNLIDLRAPILKLVWLNDSEFLVLTWSNLYHMQWLNDLKYYPNNKNYVIHNNISVKSFPAWDRFVHFDTIVSSDKQVIGLVGNADNIEYVAIDV